MRRAFVLANNAVRARVIGFIRSAPDGYRVEIREPTRTSQQNARLWAMIGDVAEQVQHGGKFHAPEVWKAIFMHSLGRECEFVPSLDETEVIPLGYRSSQLSKAEFSDLIEVIYAFGAERGVKWSDPTHGMREAAK